MSLLRFHYLIFLSFFSHLVQETYKEVLQNNRDDTALHFYIAMCHYMLDYYDFSREVLQSYTQVCYQMVVVLCL